MAGVFPILNSSPDIQKIWAAPMFWSPEIKVQEPECGNPYMKTIKVASESRVKSPFEVKIKLGPNGDEYIIRGSDKKEIPIPASCFHIRLSAKSFGAGQLIRCELY